MLEAKISRRRFLNTSTVAIGGLVVTFYIPTTSKIARAAEVAKPIVYPPNAFVQIAPDGAINMVINKLEMGQGVMTSMAQLIAEELDCDWEKVKCSLAPVDPVYNHTHFPTQMTGGSTALASSWDQHRKIGAGMREMLKMAAAKKWSVPISELKTDTGFVVHAKKGKLAYADLAEAANQFTLPENPNLKKPKDFKIIGKSVTRVDAAEKSNGKAIFGLDVQIPGMLYVMVARPSIFTAKLTSHDAKAAKSVKGVVDVIKFDDRVAVVAKNTHAAKKGRDALNVKFDYGANADASSEQMMKSFRAEAAKPGLTAKNVGNVDEKFKKAAQTMEFEYEFPFLAHAAMEPMNCTISYDGKSAEIWAGHQMPTFDRDTAAKILELPTEKVKVNTTLAGGSFGRRANKNADFVSEACKIAKLVKKPIKIVWTREDDTRGGYYRPLTFHKVKLGFDKKNQLLAWDHHIVGQSVIGDSFFESMMVKDGLESTLTEGVATTPYSIANFRCRQTRAETPMTTLWWRSVGHTHTAYVMETLMDEIAEKTKADPWEMRTKLLAKSPRHLATLELIKKQTKWGKAKPPKDHAWGLAIHESFNTVVAQVAEVSLEDGQPMIHRIWCAVNCGQVVNPEVAKSQVEGAIVFGLSALLDQHIEVKGGLVQQGNFDDYPVLRIADMPEVMVEFVKTDAPPTGLGEPGLPPIGPAVANAIYRLNKKRLRLTPFSRELKA